MDNEHVVGALIVAGDCQNVLFKVTVPPHAVITSVLVKSMIAINNPLTTQVNLKTY